MDSLSSSELAAVQQSLVADNLGNQPQLELDWAKAAFEFAELHFNLLCSVNPIHLRLTRNDDQVYRDFRNRFPKLSVDSLAESKLKSDEEKCKWRKFCEQYKGVFSDYNFGTLIRLNASGDYTDQNTTLVPRIQFYAIEIARNREKGSNHQIRNLFSTRRFEPLT